MSTYKLIVHICGNNTVIEDIEADDVAEAKEKALMMLFYGKYEDAWDSFAICEVLFTDNQLQNDEEMI